MLAESVKGVIFQRPYPYSGLGTSTVELTHFQWVSCQELAFVEIRDRSLAVHFLGVSCPLVLKYLIHIPWYGWSYTPKIPTVLEMITSPG